MKGTGLFIKSRSTHEDIVTNHALESIWAHTVTLHTVTRLDYKFYRRRRSLYNSALL